MPVEQRVSRADIAIASVRPYPHNPRKNEQAVEDIARSLDEFGYIKTSIGVDEHNVLLYGHTTLKAMQKLGWERIPEITQLIGLTPNEKKAYRIADNKLGEKSEWDEDMLTAELQSLLEDTEDFDITLLGFDEDFLEDGDPEPQEAPGRGRSNAVDQIYEVVVSCDTEQEQKRVYEKLIQEGFECRVMTL